MCYYGSGDVMEIKNIDIVFLKTPFERFKGLMFKRNFDYGVKMRCNGIHTFFMFENIDVVLTDRDDKVVMVYYDLKPNRVILPKKGVYYTYEFPSGTIKNW